MSAPSNYEQLILELINRARLNPSAEAKRLGISLNKNLDPGEISNASKQPLAYNSILNDAASGHSSWMLSRDVFSHTGANGSNPQDRMTAAGYNFTGSWTWGENIAWNGTTGTLNVLRAARNAHDGLFDSAGHRLNILNASFKEVGLGAETGDFRGYNAFMLTENFAKSGSGNFITGVAYSDNDGDDFYSIGEGRNNLSLTFSKAGSNIGSKDAWSSGGYSFKTTTTGNIDVEFSGGGLPYNVTATILLGNQNAKIDLIGNSRIEASVSTTLGQNAVSLQLLGRNDLNGNGNGLDNTLIGTIGDNTLNGRAGNDRLVGANGNDILNGGNGNDRLIGNAGDDKLRGGRGDDYLVAGDGNDLISGSSGADTIRGNSGNDRLFGGGHNDSIGGGGGNDRINAGSGNDRMSGNAGTDTFIFNAPNWGADIITDFADGLEKIVMRGSGVTAAELNVTASNGNAVVDFGGDDKITLMDMAGKIDAGDFIF